MVKFKSYKALKKHMEENKPVSVPASKFDIKNSPLIKGIVIYVEVVKILVGISFLVLAIYAMPKLVEEILRANSDLGYVVGVAKIVKAFLYIISSALIFSAALNFIKKE